MELSKWIGPDDSASRSSYNEDLQTVAESLQLVSSVFDVGKVTASATSQLMNALSKFKILQEYDAVFFVQAAEILGTEGQGFLAVVSVNSTVVSSGSQVPTRETATEWQFLGLAKLPEDFGEVYIRPETLADKISELFAPVEVDFDFDREFSRKYFVVTKDEVKLRSRITPAFLAAIKKHKNLEIEIQGKEVLVRQRKRISPEGAKTVSQVIYDLVSAKPLLLVLGMLCSLLGLGQELVTSGTVQRTIEYSYDSQGRLIKNFSLYEKSDIDCISQEIEGTWKVTKYISWEKEQVDSLPVLLQFTKDSVVLQQGVLFDRAETFQASYQVLTTGIERGEIRIENIDSSPQKYLKMEFGALHCQKDLMYINVMVFTRKYKGNPGLFRLRRQ